MRVPVQKEEGEISPEMPAAELTPEQQEAARKAEARKAAEADRAARRRMLGNIVFIGYLYQMGLLTER